MISYMFDIKKNAFTAVLTQLSDGNGSNKVIGLKF